MDFPGFRDEEVALFNAVMDAVVAELTDNQPEVRLEAMAERFVGAILSGERSFERLKAIVLGAERAPIDPYSRLAN